MPGSKSSLSKTMRPSLLLFLALLAGHTLCQCGTTLQITRVSNDPLLVDNTLYGSIAGGTRLYIKGSGFDGSSQHTNKVTIGDIDCPVDHYFTSNTQIVCQLERGEYGAQTELLVKVSACGVEIECGHHDCHLNLIYDKTPLLKTVVPQTIFAGDQVSITGIWRANSISDLKSVMIGDKNCILSEEALTTQNNLHYWYTRSIPCKSPETLAVGDYAVSVTGDNGTGFSLPLHSSFNFKVDSENEKYNLRVHPKIYKLSSNKGFLTGQIVTVQGQGFGTDLSKIELKLGDVICKATKVWSEVRTVEVEGIFADVKDEFITCEMQSTSAEPTNKIFKGGAGLIHTVWPEYITTFSKIDSGVMKDDDDKVIDPVSLGVMLSTENLIHLPKFTQRAVGIFTSKAAGDYTFWLSANRRANFQMSKTPIDKTQDLDIATMMEVKCQVDYITDFREFYDENETNQRCTVTLLEDSDYYIILTQSDDDTDNHMTLGVTVPNTDASLPNQSPNIQKVSIDHTAVRRSYKIEINNSDGGKFKLTWARLNQKTNNYDYFKETTELDINADAATLSTQIKNKTGIENTVTKVATKANGDPATTVGETVNRTLTVVITEYWNKAILPTVTGIGVTGAGSSLTVTNLVDPSLPVRGDFILSYEGVPAEKIPYNCSAEGMAKRLSEIPALTKGISAARFGINNDGASWLIMFDSIVGNASKLTFTSNLCMDCDNVTDRVDIGIIVDKEYKNASTDLVYTPIPSEMLTSFSSNPQMTLKVDTLLAGCNNGDCDYQYYEDSNTPEIESFALSDLQLTITLKTGYASMVGKDNASMNNLLVKENLRISFAETSCEVSSVALPSIVCTLESNDDNSAKTMAGRWKPSVHLGEHGFLKYSSSFTDLEDVEVDISNVVTTEGSLAGGTLIKIEGAGFSTDHENYPNQVDIVFNSTTIPCDIRTSETTSQEIKCITRPSGSTTTQVAKLKITVNGLTVETDFTYISTTTPKITAISPKTSSPVLKNDLVITGQNFDAIKANNTVVLKSRTDASKEYPCTVTSASTTEITCRLSGGRAGEYDVIVNVSGVGNTIATPPNAGKFTYEIVVDSVSPQIGSIQGGVELTITGKNFSTKKTENQVVIGESGFDLCQITSATETELKCVVQKNDDKFERVASVSNIYVLGRAREEATCDTATICKIDFSPVNTPTVTDITPKSAVEGTSITVTGTKFLIGADVTIMIGDVQANNATVVNATKIIFDMPAISRSTHNPTVHIKGLGYAKFADLIELQSRIEFTDVSPKFGGKAGNFLTLTGNGFIKDKMTVKVGPKECFIFSQTPSEIKCDTRYLGVDSSIYDVIVKYEDEEEVKHEVECNTCKYTTMANTPRIRTLNNIDLLTNANTGTFVFVMQNAKEMVIADGSTVTLDQSKFECYFEAKDKDKFPNVKFDAACTFTDVPTTNKTSVTVQVSELMAGEFEFGMFLPEVGDLNPSNKVPLPIVNPQISFLPSDRAFAKVATPAVQSSLLGGADLVIEGLSFPSNEYKDLVKVSVCGLPCLVTSSRFDQISCITPLLNTKAIQEDMKMQKPTVQRDAIQIWDNSATTAKNLIDGDILTYSYGTPGACSLQLDYGEGNIISASKLRMFPRMGKDEANLKGMVFSIKLKETDDYTPIFTINETPMENWNDYRPPNGETWDFRFIKLSNEKDECFIAELEVIGFKFRDIANVDPDSHDCPVEVQIMDIPPVSTNLYKVTYKNTNTPKITGITPDMGTTIGGTEISIAGTNFLSSDTTVTIDGVDCPVDQGKSSSTMIVCTTQARATFTESTLEVLSVSRGIAFNNGHRFLYIDRWSNPNTWGGELPPREGDSVHVPAGQVLLVDQSTPILNAVIVEGVLIFEDQPKMTFDAWFIMINNGRFEIGTPEKRYTGDLTITLYGDRYSKMIPVFGNKGIMGHNASIDIHGVKRNFTWTKLAAPVKQVEGQEIKTITVEDSVDWKAGEVVIIAPTGSIPEEAEKRVIKSVSGNQITFEEKLNFNHFQGEVDLNDPTDNTHSDTPITLAAEVGLLSRNITIQGDESTNESRHGVHIMLRGDEGVAYASYSYMEVRNAGQEFQLGRYPIHFHMIGNVHGMYVEGCAVHDTFNRGTTIHGVHYLHVFKNVYHNIQGHCIFLEDGIEINNIIEDNLVISVHKSMSMLMSDMEPSGIWMARPNNYVRRNHFVGSKGNGAWIQAVEHPTGPSATTEICSLRDHLMEYKDNVHHTNKIGFKIYPRLWPKERPCDEPFNFTLRDPFAENPGKAAKIVDNVYYSNDIGSLGKIIGRLEYINNIWISNSVNQVIVKPHKAKDSRPRNEGGVSVGESILQTFHTLHEGSGTCGLSFGQTGGFFVKDTLFYNFPDRVTMFKFCSGCDSEVKRTEGGKRQTFENIRLVKASPKIIGFNKPEYDQDIIIDNDGELIKHLNLPANNTIDFSQGGSVTYFQKHLADHPKCVKIEKGNGCSADCVVCNHEVKLVVGKLTATEDFDLLAGQDLKIFNRSRGTFDPNHVVDENTDNERNHYGISKMRNCKLSLDWQGWTPVVAAGEEYNLHFGRGVEWKELKFENDYLWDLYAKDDVTYFRWNHTEPRETYIGKFNGLDVGVTGLQENNLVGDPVIYWKDKSVANLFTTTLADPTTAFGNEHALGDYYHDSKQKELWWKLDGKRIGALTSEVVYCTGLCVGDGDDGDDNHVKKLWNLAVDWSVPAVDNVPEIVGAVPVEGEVVTIQRDWDMHLNVKTPRFKKVVIHGKLRFDPDEDDLELNADLIVIESGGQLIIGSKDAPFEGSAIINLHGDKDSTYEVVSPLIAPVNKAILNKGKFFAYGKPPTVTWSRLGAKATKGSNIIFLKENTNNMGWKSGDEIVIASSSTNYLEHEKVEIDTFEAGSPHHKITLKGPLKFNHYGAASALSTEQGVLDMRAEVGHLSRNIKIQSIAGDDWGCTILTANIPPAPKSNDTADIGMIQLDGVEIKDCGQRGTSKAAIDIKFVKSASYPHSIKNSTINNGLGWGVDLDGSGYLDLTNNVIYNVRKTGIYMKNVDQVLIEKNLIIGINKQPDYNNAEYFDIMIGIHYDSTKALSEAAVTVRHNNVSSSEWFALALPGYACDDNPAALGSTRNFYNNTAHSSRAGWFPTIFENQECNVYAHFIGYKNDEEGFAQRGDVYQVYAKHMILADNRNSFSMNAAPGKVIRKQNTYAKLSDSVIIGKALADCPECYTDERECETSGIYSALFNGSPFSFYFEHTRFPLHNSTSSNFRIGGKQDIENVRFENFNVDSTCANKTYAIRMNNFYQHNTNAISLSNLRVINVDQKSKFFFANHKRHLNTPVYCGKRDCTGNYNTPFFNPTGEIMGREMHFFGNNLKAGRDGDCTFYADWNGHACEPVYGQLTVSSPPDKRGLVYYPLKVSVEGYEENTPENQKFYNEADGPNDVQTLVKLSKINNLTFSQTMPSGVNYQLRTGRPEDWIIVKVHSENPATMGFYLRKGRRPKRPVIVKPGESLDLSKYKNLCGVNFYDQEMRNMYFVLTGEDNCYGKVKIINSLKLSTRLNIDPAEFFSSGLDVEFIDKMAALLGIEADRIRIVEVVEGSTIVKVAVDSDLPAEEDRDNKEAVEQELQNFEDKFKQAIADGADMGAEVLSVEAEIALDDVEPVVTNDSGSGDGSGDGSSAGTGDNAANGGGGGGVGDGGDGGDGNDEIPKKKMSLPLIIGLAAGIPLFLAIVAVVTFCICKKVKKGKQSYKNGSKKTAETTNLTKDFSQRNLDEQQSNEPERLAVLGSREQNKIPNQVANEDQQDIEEYVERRE